MTITQTMILNLLTVELNERKKATVRRSIFCCVRVCVYFFLHLFFHLIKTCFPSRYIVWIMLLFWSHTSFTYFIYIIFLMIRAAVWFCRHHLCTWLYALSSPIIALLRFRFLSTKRRSFRSIFYSLIHKNVTTTYHLIAFHADHSPRKCTFLCQFSSG